MDAATTLEKTIDAFNDELWGEFIKNLYSLTLHIIFTTLLNGCLVMLLFNQVHTLFSLQKIGLWQSICLWMMIRTLVPLRRRKA